MRCCSPKCKKVTAFTVGGLFLILGLLAVFLWMDLYEHIIKNQLTITKDSMAFKMWKDTPIPIYLSIYLYNWTNAEEVLNGWTIKPELEELGPYVFLEKHERVDLEWKDNDTMIRYLQVRRWVFEPDKSNGSLADDVSSLNVIASAVAYKVRKSNYFIKKAVDLLLNEKEKSLVITKTAAEWIFDGFDDELIELAMQLNISLGGFDKFGWFYKRNNSKTYDGSWTMYTGIDDFEKLGIIELWNDKPVSPHYPSYCGYVNGTSGELWPPVVKYDKVSVFASDICSTATIFHDNNNPTLSGIVGKEYEGTDFLFDNGTKYPEQACFNGEEIFPSGIRDISKCKFGAPAFISFPHFYLADPVYRTKINGMNPVASKHKFRMALQPDTGLPLYVDARLQINLRLTKISGIKLFENVEEIMWPMFWSQQSAVLTEPFIGQVKLIISLPTAGIVAGYVFICISLVMCSVYVYRNYKAKDVDDMDQVLIFKKG